MIRYATLHAFFFFFFYAMAMRFARRAMRAATPRYAPDGAALLAATLTSRHASAQGAAIDARIEAQRGG